jgi:ribulose-phosphate 3-epimerase
MVVIAPTILVEDQEAYNQKIAALTDFAERVHIDVSDGEFSPTLTLQEDQIWWPKEWQADLHMMVKYPSQHIDAVVNLHPSLAIFHVEVDEDLLPILDTLKKNDIKAGIALLKTTYPPSVQQYIEAADHVMIFSGELGKNNGKASMLQLEKVHMVKKMNALAEIGWDGGANEENVFGIAGAGVDVINVGGAIDSAMDMASTYKILVKMANKRGVI